MDWISGLTGLSSGALITIIIVAILTNIPNIIKLVKVLKDRKIEVGELSDHEKMMKEGEKALNDCKALIIKAIPPDFNYVQKWVVELMLFKAFQGQCLLHIRGLAARNGFGSMSDIRFERYCVEEMPRVLRAVSDSLSDDWEGRESFFPISREAYEEHNYRMAARECGQIVINWFKYCRAVKQKEEGVA